MDNQANYDYLTKAPVGKVILKMAVPTVISMLVISLYNVVDTYYVGRISTQATAAVGVVFPLMTILQACGFFFGQGSGTYISRRLGAKDAENARKMASMGFFNSFAFGCIISIVGLVFQEPLAKALGSTDTILPYTKDFMGIILLGAPFVTASMTLNNQLRFQGQAYYAMFGTISGAVLNVVTVPVFAFALDMGVKGAAIGTVIGQLIGFIVLLLMTRKEEVLNLEWSKYTTETSFHKELIKGGTPSLTRQALASISTLLLNLAASRYGDAAIAGMSIVGRVSMMVFSVILGLGQGFQPLCGFSYGAGLYDRVKKGFWYCIKAGLAIIVPLSILCFIFSAEIIDFLRHDPQVVVVGSAAFRWQLISFPIAIFVTISNMTLQTSGRALSANLLASCRNGICFIPLILVLPAFMGLYGIEMCQALADILSLVFAVPLIRRYFRSLDKCDTVMK